MPVSGGGGFNSMVYLLFLPWSLFQRPRKEEKRDPAGNEVALCLPFRSHQDTKMAARRNQRSTSTISGKNRGL